LVKKGNSKFGMSLPAIGRYIGLNFSTVHCNWISQLHFHFSYQPNYW